VSLVWQEDRKSPVPDDCRRAALGCDRLMTSALCSFRPLGQVIVDEPVGGIRVVIVSSREFYFAVPQRWVDDIPKR
jgi:hypothetical protein